MTIELKQEILDLIESPELYVYLMEHAERLKLRDYVSIIAGAPVGLKRKQGLLYKLRAISDIKQQDMDYLKLCCECMDQAVRYLTMESEKIFLIQLMGYNDDNKSDIMDVWCKSVNIAKRTIESAEEPILLIDCDHDLGDYAYDGGDGIKLLDWLAENDRFYPIRLHTMNPVGRENMLRMIRRYW